MSGYEEIRWEIRFIRFVATPVRAVAPRATHGPHGRMVRKEREASSSPAKIRFEIPTSNQTMEILLLDSFRGISMPVVYRL
jgi:hypothetical protein